MNVEQREQPRPTGIGRSPWRRARKEFDRNRYKLMDTVTLSPFATVRNARRSRSGGSGRGNDPGTTTFSDFGTPQATTSNRGPAPAAKADANADPRGEKSAFTGTTDSLYSAFDDVGVGSGGPPWLLIGGGLAVVWFIAKRKK